MIKLRFRSFLLQGALLLAAMFGWQSVARADQRSILTPDGTLFHVESGLYGSLDPAGTAADTNDYVIRWDSLSQSGDVASGIIPGTNSPEIKDEFDLAYDSISRSLILVWNDRLMLINNIQFAVLQNGIWTQVQLLPSNVFTFASHPSILVTHQTVKTLDDAGNEVDTPRSIASVVWWEGSAKPRARFAPVFIDANGIDVSDITIYDLPELTGSASVLVPGHLDNPLYREPVLQADGLLSGIIATFADVSTNSLRVTRIDFQSDFRSPIDPQHGRHVIVILGTQIAPLPSIIPATAIKVGTVIGGGYQPTIYWQTDSAGVDYIMFNGLAWSEPRVVALTPTLTLDNAISLISTMSARS